MARRETLTQRAPFPSRREAAYWGGGVLVAADGGWYSLHARSTPAGVETYHVALAAGRPVIVDGWPPSVRGRYVWATPDDGGPACICTAEM